ncbi:MAG: multicopper oxidase family protein [Beijerinckiaceae bacterium]|nr:multicopper oxidase family protein [Beijerinckiaceae bacterium]
MDQPSRPSRRALLAGSLGSLAATILALPARSVEAPRREPERLTLRPAALQRRMKPDFTAEASLLAYNNTLPGPLLRIRKGGALNVRLENALAQPTSIHWYGVRGPSAMDGVAGLTQAAVKPAETFDYQFTPPDSGIFWYHPLVQGSCAEQVDRGLAGMLLVEEQQPPAVDHDLAVIIDDWRFEPSGAMSADFANIDDRGRAGRLGNFLTVNGLAAPQPLASAPGSRLRLRFLNVANARACPLKFENVQARVMAIDGQPCDPFDPLRRTVIMAPGSRFDIMVDLPSEEGSEGRIGIALGQVLPLLVLKGEGTKVEPRPPIVALQGNGLPPAIKLQSATRADLVITGGFQRGADAKTGEAAQRSGTTLWQLNNGAAGGFAGKPLFTVKRGSPVVLALVNKSAWAQVIHVHGHNFRLLHPFDDGWEPYFLDTLYLAEGQTSRISFVADNPGRWAIRSSILEHFEGGVATWFDVMA